MSIRSPQAPSTLKVYNCCPRAGPAQVGGGAPRGAAGAGGGIFENTLLYCSLLGNPARNLEFLGKARKAMMLVLPQSSDLSKLTISVNLYLSPSHLQSLGAQLGTLGDGEKARSRTRF